MSESRHDVGTATVRRSKRFMPTVGGCAALTVLLAALLLPPRGAAIAQSVPNVTATAASSAAIADYRRKLKEYTAARQSYEAQAEVYWTSVTQKRQVRIGKRGKKEPTLLEDYVLTQPPRYSGPPRPVDPSSPTERPPPQGGKYVPVIADFLESARQFFDFVPKRPGSEIEFKRAYVRVAEAAGLTRDQVVRIYGFESGGDGKYDVQAGLEYSKTGRAISTALGYNQLLHVNSVSLMAEKGESFIAALTAKLATLQGEAKAALEQKIAVIRRMIAFSRTVPVRWSEHEKLADTPTGLGLHAMNLDIDVGPLLQTQKLVDSVAFARRRGRTAPLTAAELELMNLTGDGNGYDMVSMPKEMRPKVPTANFFRQASYERNPVAIRNNVVAKLLAATDTQMDQESKRKGAKDMAALFGR